MTDQKIDGGKRTWIIASSCAGAIGAGFVAVPFVSSFEPSERARAAGAPVEVDISALKPGEKMTVEWRGKPVWIVRRTPEQLAELPKLDGQLADPKSKRNADELTPPYARNEDRSIKPEILVVVGICTHLGCSPSDKFVPGPAALAARQLGRRLPLPLPRLDLRHGRPRLQGQARARQPGGTAARVPVGQPDPHRRGKACLSGNPSPGAR